MGLSLPRSLENDFEMVSCIGRSVRRDNVFVLALSMLLLGVMVPELVGAVTDPGDIHALAEVKLAINPTSIMVSSCVGSWNFSADPCDSHFSPIFTCGIDCSPGPNGVARITGLRLDPAGYNGTLSPSVGNLTALQRLAVSGNGFYGSIPPILDRLTSLLQLDLSSNQFSGTLPPSLGALGNLQYFSVANNVLVGNIPWSFNNLTNVTQMFLYGNGFSGLLTELAGMTSLMTLDASSNNFTGHLPYLYPPTLQVLSLGNNNFAGRLPRVLQNLTNLGVLDLRVNNLRGTVKEFLFNLPSLQQLNLSHNNFSRVEYVNVSGVNSFLASVDLRGNSLRGLLPEFFAGLKELVVLSLGSNFFSGPIPNEYGLRAVNAVNGSYQMTQLYLDNNYLSGPLPVPFLSLTSDNITASFVNNCLDCPPSIPLCQDGLQRSKAECNAFQAG